MQKAFKHKLHTILTCDEDNLTIFLKFRFFPNILIYTVGRIIDGQCQHFLVWEIIHHLFVLRTFPVVHPQIGFALFRRTNFVLDKKYKRVIRRFIFLNPPVTFRLLS